MLITPIFPQYSAILDPLSSYYMPEELVAHITAGVAVGREPYFFGVAYEVSLVVVQALIMLAEVNGTNTFVQSQRHQKSHQPPGPGAAEGATRLHRHSGSRTAFQGYAEDTFTPRQITIPRWQVRCAWP